MFKIQAYAGIHPTTGQETWEDVGPLGGDTETYSSQGEAEGRASHLYPERVDAYNRGGPQTVRVVLA